MKVVDSRRMAEIDREAQERFGIPEIVLMEDAAAGIFNLLWQRVWNAKIPDGPLAFLCGKGNNAGDAMAVARLCFYRGIEDLSVILGAGEPAAQSLAGIHLGVLRSLGIEVLDFADSGAEVRKARRVIAEARWLLDGLLGTGLSGAVRGPIDPLIRLGNQSSAYRIAVDIPSGIGDNFREGYTALRADCTCTVQLPKLCLFLPHARRFCGQIHVVPGVFPPQLVREEPERISGFMIDESSTLERLRPTDADAHKGTRGHLAVFAGAEGTTGAAWLAANAAARSRAGLVTVFTDRQLYAANVPKYGSLMLRPWDGDPPPLDRYDALLVGPGWGVSEKRIAVLKQLLESDLPGVLDADGITLLAEIRRSAGSGPMAGQADASGWILTPHPGEFARLLHVEIAEVLADPLTHLLAASSALEATIVLKGHCTYVAAPDGRYGVLDGMNPALATGGSGDVLAGICAGLLASGHQPPEAAVIAVELHARIGRQLYRDRGYFLAEDMLCLVSEAVR